MTRIEGIFVRKTTKNIEDCSQKITFVVTGKLRAQKMKGAAPSRYAFYIHTH